MFESKILSSTQENPNLFKKCRIIFSDPDATDSSSDDEETQENKNRIKRFVKEITWTAVPFESSSSPQLNDMNIAGSCYGKRRRPMSKGVRKRPWGKFAAEIRDPINKKQIWLGTYSTEQEASAVYNKKKHEFESMMAAACSPSSVLDICVEDDLEEANHKDQKTIMNRYTMKKVVREYKVFEECKKTEEEAPPVMELLWEPPSISESWMEEIFGPVPPGVEDHWPYYRQDCWSTDNAVPPGVEDHWPYCGQDCWSTDNAVEYEPWLPENLPEIKIDNVMQDLAWVDEIFNIERVDFFAIASV